MRKLFVGLTLVMVSTGIMAEWTAVGESVSAFTYVNFATISKNGDMAKMSEMTDFKVAINEANGEKYFSQESYSEYDCKKGKSRILTLTDYSGHMGNGKVLYYDKFNAELSPNVTDSGGEIFWKLACGKYEIPSVNSLPNPN